MSPVFQELLIPMLSLKDSGWLGVVRRLIPRCTRIVMLLDTGRLVGVDNLPTEDVAA